MGTKWQRVRHREGVPGELLELLQGYPFKSFQQGRLKVDSDGLARYQFETFQKVDLSRTAFFTLQRGSEVEGCFALSPHGWHSELFGVSCYRVGHLLEKPGADGIQSVLAAALAEESIGLDVELVGVRVDAEDLLIQRALAEVGFQVVGHSVKLALTRDKLDITRLNDYASTQYSALGDCVREFAPEDLPTIRNIAQASHQYSHFFNDPRLARRGVERLFPEWVEKCAKGAAAGILIATDGAGRPVGFVTLLLNRKLADYTGQAAGVIDFIAIAPQCQGRGLGGRLVLESLKWLAQRSDYIEVRTELVNFPAIRLYEKFGLELVSADVDFHRWNQDD